MIIFLIFGNYAVIHISYYINKNYNKIKELLITNRRLTTMAKFQC